MRKLIRFQCVAFALLLAGLAGCSSLTGPKAAPGDTLLLDFTCRLPDGGITATTLEETARDSSRKKSSIFNSKKVTYAPVETRVPKAESGNARPSVTGYERILAHVLAKKMTGARQGEQRTVQVSPTDVQRASGAVIDMARIRMRPKEMEKPIDQWAYRLGHEPRVGDEIIIDPAVPGKIVSVGESTATVHFYAEPGSTVETPLGPAVVKDAGDRWELHIQAKEGDIVRSQEMVGRVLKVDERMITIDYGHPFGYASMTCDVVVDSLKTDQRKK